MPRSVHSQARIADRSHGGAGTVLQLPPE